MMHKEFKILIILISIIFIISSNSQDKTELKLVVKNKDGKSDEIKIYNKMYALIVGIDSFEEITPLKNCVNDAEGINNTLKKFYEFEKIETLYNTDATRANILEKFNEMQEQFNITENDAFFVFIASHGITFNDVGFIIPYDGSFEEKKSYRNISMLELKDVVGNMLLAKHIFYVIDACYSGSILTRGTELKKADDNLIYLKEITKERVRYALTAGDKGQAVLDGGPKGHSVFTGRFIEALELTDNYITGSELSEKISKKVFNDAKDRGHIQTPQYGRLSGLGNFVFIRKGGSKLENIEKEIQEIKEQMNELNKKLEDSKNKNEKEKIEIELQKTRAFEEKKKLEMEEFKRIDELKKQEELRMIEIENEKKLNEEKQKIELKKIMFANEEKKKILEEINKYENNPKTIISQIIEVEKIINEIISQYNKSKNDAINNINIYYKRKYEMIKNYKIEAWEKQLEFEERKKSDFETFRWNEYEEINFLNKKYDDDLKENLKYLQTSLDVLKTKIIIIKGKDVKVVFGEFNIDNEVFPVTITSLLKDLKYNDTISFEIKSNNSTERKEKYEKIIKIIKSNGFIGEIAFGFTYSKKNNFYSTVALYVKVIDLTDNNKEIFIKYSKEYYEIEKQKIEDEIIKELSNLNEDVEKLNAIELQDYKVKLDGFKHIAFEKKIKIKELDEKYIIINKLIEKKWNEKYGINYVYIKGGIFKMGDNFGGNIGFELPVHEVKIRNFIIGKYEVTQKEWIEIMNNNPSKNKGIGEDISILPVENISWYDAIEFCNNKSLKESLTPVYTINKSAKDPNNLNNDDNLKWIILINWDANGYRLPTEAEWEYAARGGEKSCGFQYSGSDIINEVAFYKKNSEYKSNKIGMKKANELLIYDMSGNVSEWCWDWPEKYTAEKIDNPKGAIAGYKKTTRGGNWVVDESFCRVADRTLNINAYKHDDLTGLRLARSILSE